MGIKLRDSTDGTDGVRPTSTPVASFKRATLCYIISMVLARCAPVTHCPSVCLPQVGGSIKTTKRITSLQRKQRRTITDKLNPRAIALV